MFQRSTAALSKHLARPVCQVPSGLAACSVAATVLRLRSATVALRRGPLPQLSRALRQRFAFPGLSVVLHSSLFSVLFGILIITTYNAWAP
jgi:hypothetical protein